MTDRADARFGLHEDVPLFREAISFTAAKTGFAGQVIEKDCFCTILLDDLARHGGVDLTFKGGTCLAKVHAGLHRLSEDLDFAFRCRSMHAEPNEATRRKQSKARSRARIDAGRNACSPYDTFGSDKRAACRAGVGNSLHHGLGNYADLSVTGSRVTMDAEARS